MPKKIDYEQLFTHRKDGRWQKVVKGKTLIDRDPERLLQRIQEVEKPTPPTFNKIADAWEIYHFSRIKYKTAEAYTAPLRRIKEHFRNMPFEQLSAMQIQAYISELAKQQYARRTVQMHLDIIRMICNYGILQGYAITNPSSAVSIPKGLHTEKRELPTDMEMEIVKTSWNKPFGLFAYFLLYSGLRRGEALALTYGDINFTDKVIHVNKSVSFEGNIPVLKSTKTEAGTRDVILLDILADKLDHNGKGLLFGDKGKLLSKTQFRRRWAAYQKEMELTLTPHQLRHGFATILYEAEIADKDAQELLGHSNISVTRNIYTHIRQSRKQETATKLNAFVAMSSRG